MKINGNLSFNNSATDVLRNVNIEAQDMGATEAAASSYTATNVTGESGGNVEGRILYNNNGGSGDGYYYYDGAAWVRLATGGATGSIQSELDATQATIGNMMDANGDAVTTNMNALSNVTGASTISEVLSQLDAAIEGKDTLEELDDTDITGTASGDVLYWNGTDWANAQPGATSGVQAYDAALDNLSNVAGTGILVQTAADTFATRSVVASTNNDELGIVINDGAGASGDIEVGVDITGLTDLGAGPATDDEILIYDLDATQNKKVTIADLATSVGGAVALGGLSDVTDAQTGTLTTGDKYFFNATGASAYEVAEATLGALNNVAAGVDTATVDDVLAFDGTEWTAITPATFAGDFNIGDIGDVTITTVADGDVLQYNSGTSEWENVAAGVGSGIQPYDAGLANLATGGTGMVSMDGDDVFYRTLSVADTARLTVTNGAGTGGNPTFDLATLADSGSGTFLKLTRDAYGRVSGTEAVATADITALVDSEYVNVSGDVMTGNLDMGGTGGPHKIVNLADPTASADAANKAYVDSVAQGLAVRPAVKAATTTNLAATYNNGTSGVGATLTADSNGVWPGVDGITTGWDANASGPDADGVLVKDQTNAFENGRYFLADAGSSTTPWVLERCGTCDEDDEIPSSFVFVQEGNTYANTGWAASVGDPTAFTVGTDAITWTQFSGAGSFTAGIGLTLTGTTFDVNLGAGIVELPSDEVGIDVASGVAIGLTSTATGGQLTLNLDGTTLTQSASGLAIAAGGVTETELNTSVAGDGLVGGGGTPLSANVDGSTIVINADVIELGTVPNANLDNDSINTAGDSGAGSVALGGTLTIVGGTGISTTDNGSGQITVAGNDATTTTKGIASFAAADFSVASGAVSIAAGGVSNTQLANSVITMSDGTATDDVALGETFTITGGTLTTTTVTANTVTIDVAADTSDLGDVTAAASAAGQVLVADGSNDYTPQQIQYIHTESVAAATWNVNHALGQQYVNVTVVDGNDEVIIPDTITMDDANNLTVTFNTAVDGKAIVMGVPGVS